MKILFLDFDGVLNCSNTWPEHGGRDWIDPDMVGRLNRLCLAAGAHIVVSSTWRLNNSLSDLRGALYSRGLDRSVLLLSITPDYGGYPDKCRGDEIAAWLSSYEAQRRGVKTFVILDDDGDMGALKHRLVQTTWQDGLQERHVEEAVEMFRGGCGDEDAHHVRRDRPTPGSEPGRCQP